jgi:hypothetical protein
VFFFGFSNAYWLQQWQMNPLSNESPWRSYIIGLYGIELNSFYLLAQIQIRGEIKGMFYLPQRSLQLGQASFLFVNTDAGRKNNSKWSFSGFTAKWNGW